jgi:hypothetical protein
MGASPTLDLPEIEPFVPQLAENFISISINLKPYKTDLVSSYLKCAYTIGIDEATWIYVENLIKNGTIPPDFSKWVAPEKFRNLQIPYYMNFKSDSVIDADGDKAFVTGSSSLLPALNLALEEGAQRVVIVASEMQTGTAHADNPGQIYNPKNWQSRSERIKTIVEKYKDHFKEMYQIANGEHLLDIPCVTPQWVLENC